MADGAVDVGSVAYAAMRLALSNAPLARAMWRRMLCPAAGDAVMDREGHVLGTLVRWRPQGACVACSDGEERCFGSGFGIVAVPTREMVEAAERDAEAEIGSGRV